MFLYSLASGLLWKHSAKTHSGIRPTCFIIDGFEGIHQSRDAERKHPRGNYSPTSGDAINANTSETYRILSYTISERYHRINGWENASCWKPNLRQHKRKLFSRNLKSVKPIFSTFRLDANKCLVTTNYVNDRTNHVLDDGSWTFEIAGFKVPQQKFVGFDETGTELQKAFHDFNSVDGHGIHTKIPW